MKRFDDVHQALAYYRYKNPARQQFKNILEQEKHTADIAEQFSGDHPADIWASVVGAIQYTLQSYRFEDRRLFELTELDDDRLHIDDAAESLFLNKHTAKKRKYKILDELERELMRREIVEFKD